MTRLKPTLLALSASGLLAIAGYEGYSATAYKDTGGISTVGFGHTGPEVKPGTRVTVVQFGNECRMFRMAFTSTKCDGLSCLCTKVIFYSVATESDRSFTNTYHTGNIVRTSECRIVFT